MIPERSTLAAQTPRWFLIISLSIICGYAVFYGFYTSQMSRGIGVKTDIVGYPAFANFNIYALVYGYGLGLLAAFAASLILARYILPWRLDESSPVLRELLLGLPLVILVGLFIAFAEVLRSRGTWYSWVTANCALLIACKIGASTVDQRLAKTGKSARAGCFLSILLAMAVPAVLFYISQNTGWQASPHKIVHARWFPIPVLVVSEILILVFGYRCLKREAGSRIFDKYSVRFLLVPGSIFLLTAVLPGARTLGDEFHSGEKLAPLVLGLRGLLPWRDFLFVHGVWDDFLQLYLPARMWEPTLRAGVAGTPLLFGPLYWVAFYFVFLIIFDLSLLRAFVAFFVLISIYFPDPYRFLLYPVILLCLFHLLRRRKPILCVLLIVLCGVQILISPEFGLLAAGIGLVIFLRDILERDRHRSLVSQFRQTLVCAASAAVFIGLAGWWLSSNGFLDGFLITVVDFSRGHLLTGGEPLQMIDSVFWLTGLPLLFVFGSTVVFAVTYFRSRREVPAILWLIWGITLCTALYYPKYLGRADSHIIQVLAVSSPGIALFSMFLLERAGQFLRARYQPWVWSAAGGLSLSALIVFGIPGIPSPNWFSYVPDEIGSVRGRFIAADQDASFAAMTATPAPAARIAALRQFFDARLHPGDAVFDFSDSPTLFFVVLRLKPASRFINVSMAIQEEAQMKVVNDLEKSRPPYVIYHSEGGLNDWDGIPNEVRHYFIAHYINLHYVYDRTIEGSVIFRRADLAGKSIDDGGAANLSTCDLGYAPNVFAPRVAPREQENAWAPAPINSSYLLLSGWAALDGSDVRPDIEVNYKGTVLDRFQPDFVRLDVEKALGRRSPVESGFRRRIELPDPAISAEDIDVRGSSSAAGKLFHFKEGPLQGNVDSITVIRQVSLLPARLERPAYLGLEFADNSSKEPQQFQIISPGSQNTLITFTKVGRENKLMLPLGGCYAWGAISKSTPQVGSSKPFTLKSASYYYE